MNVVAISAIVYARCLIMALAAMDASMEERGAIIRQIREMLEKLDSTLEGNLEDGVHVH
jgi:hypothetical protein